MLHVITVPSNLQSKGYLEVSKGYPGVSGGIWGSGWKYVTPSKYPSTLWRYPTKRSFVFLLFLLCENLQSQISIHYL